ncbi:hypothetical protein T484DRAFT_2236264 [Baffinella frigidus]|nr:hypothetical protein T484DRAFT_2236264 [Cryptophyta sp. CCMP2293]
MRLLQSPRGGWFLMSEVPLWWSASLVFVGTLDNRALLRGRRLLLRDRLPHEATTSFSSLRFFELPTWADTGTGSVERPCVVSDHISTFLNVDCRRFVGSWS